MGVFSNENALVTLARCTAFPLHRVDVNIEILEIVGEHCVAPLPKMSVAIDEFLLSQQRD